MNVSLRQLRVFLAVSRLRHFGRAAEQLHLTQPAISRHIADLEAELGVRLLDRSTREVVPTEPGRYLHSAVERVLDELENVLAHVRTEGEGRRGTVRVAAAPTPSASLMPRCIAECARDYPELTLHLRDQPQTQVLDSVRGGEVDFGVAIDPPDNREFDKKIILHDPFVLVCRNDHPLARLDRVPWKKLHGETVVLLDYSSGSRRLIDRILEERGITVHVAQQTSHTHTAFRLVEAGIGCSITPALSLPVSDDLSVRPLTPTSKRAITLIRRKHRSLSPAAEQVWNHLCDMTARLNPTSRLR
ncbi:LysR family transcriptional regulator [Oleiagrimonas soli]|uniref:DNA-binding transcriptional LysR family regulator n=1 Tax=Oleiagrimonas soli TaxID=1543381 RepID=A0A841KGZ5_9GAMM|nr:LysR family transcriptional regulator [Oleiagrimonas soli]MBB6183267.1 DNA-binding transcriptional LysR family regulator [Oleiagrimonas soli]